MKVIKQLEKGLVIGILGAMVTVPCFAGITSNDQYLIKKGINEYKSDLLILSNSLTQAEIVNYIKSARLYNISSFKMSKSSDTVILYPEYYETKTEMAGVNRLASLVANEVAGLTPTEKVYFISQRISELMKYSTKGNSQSENVEIFSPTAVSKSGEGVCQAYARLADVMLRNVGLETALIEGKINSTPHLWNAVKINNEWYAVDVTSADEDKSEKIDFNFILMTNNNMKDSNYIVTYSPVNFSNNDIKLTDEVGLISLSDKAFYFTTSDNKTLMSYDYNNDIIGVVNSVDNYWVVGGQLFYRKDNQIINRTNKEVYYSDLTGNDVIVNKNGELYVNGNLVYNGTNLTGTKVGTVNGSFKVKVNSPTPQPMFFIQDTANKVNVFYNNSFLVQYLKIN